VSLIHVSNGSRVGLHTHKINFTQSAREGWPLTCIAEPCRLLTFATPLLNCEHDASFSAQN